MTATALMILLLACVVAVFIGVALVTWWEIRQEMAWRDRWLTMPGSTDSSSEDDRCARVYDWSQNP